MVMVFISVRVVVCNKDLEYEVVLLPVKDYDKEVCKQCNMKILCDHDDGEDDDDDDEDEKMMMKTTKR